MTAKAEFIPDGYGRFVTPAEKAKIRTNHGTGRFNSKEYIKILELENKELKEKVEKVEKELKRKDDLFILIALENNILDVSPETRVSSYIAKKYRKDPNLLMSKSSENMFPFYRGMIFYLLYKVVEGSTYKEIGQRIGFSRFAIMDGVERIEKQMAVDKKLRMEMEEHINWINENIKQ